jgi:hypothetical protein
MRPSCRVPLGSQWPNTTIRSSPSRRFRKPSMRAVAHHSAPNAQSMDTQAAEPPRPLWRSRPPSKGRTDGGSPESSSSFRRHAEAVSSRRSCGSSRRVEEQQSPPRAPRSRFRIRRFQFLNKEVPAVMLAHIVSHHSTPFSRAAKDLLCQTRRDTLAVMNRRLTPDDEIRCLHCRRWHRVYRPHNEGTEATRQMLYFDCRQLRYFAGFVGSPSRHETRCRA